MTRTLVATPDPEPVGRWVGGRYHPAVPTHPFTTTTTGNTAAVVTITVPLPRRNP